MLLEGIGLHEMPELAVGVEILHVGVDHVGAFERLAGLERLFHRAPVQQVADADAGKRLTLARLDELGLDDRARITVDDDLDTVLDVVQAVGRHTKSSGVDGLIASRAAGDQRLRWGIAGHAPEAGRT